MEQEEIKPFQCKECGSTFNWVNSLRKHKRNIHQDTSATFASNSRSKMKRSRREASSTPNSSQGDSPKAVSTPTKAKLKVESKFFNPAICRMVKSGLISHNLVEKKDVQSPSSPCGEASTAKKQQETPSKRSSPRIKSMPGNNSVMEVNDPKRKLAVLAEEPEDSTPPPVVVTDKKRDALKRNIKKPKWLEDADLVSSYELPGSSKMRKVYGNSLATSTAPAISKGQDEVQTVPSKSKEDCGEKQQSYLGIVWPPPPPPSLVREIKEIATTTVTQVVRTKTKPKKKVIKGTTETMVTQAPLMKMEPTVINEPMIIKETIVDKEATVISEPILNKEPTKGNKKEAGVNKESKDNKVVKERKALTIKKEAKEKKEKKEPKEKKEKKEPKEKKEKKEPKEKKEKKEPKEKKESANKSAKKEAGQKVANKAPQKKRVTKAVPVAADDAPNDNVPAVIMEPRPIVFIDLEPELMQAEPEPIVIDLESVVDNLPRSPSSHLSSKILGMNLNQTSMEKISPLHAATPGQKSSRKLEVPEAPKGSNSAKKPRRELEKIEDNNTPALGNLTTPSPTVQLIFGSNTSKLAPNHAQNKGIVNAIKPATNPLDLFTFGSRGSFVDRLKVKSHLATTPSTVFKSQGNITFSDLAHGRASVQNFGKSTTETETITEDSPLAEKITSVESEVQEAGGLNIDESSNQTNIPALKPEALKPVAISGSDGFTEGIDNLDQEASASSTACSSQCSSSGVEIIEEITKEKATHSVLLSKDLPIFPEPPARQETMQLGELPIDDNLNSSTSNSQSLVAQDAPVPVVSQDVTPSAAEQGPKFGQLAIIEEEEEGVGPEGNDASLSDDDEGDSDDDSADSDSEDTGSLIDELAGRIDGVTDGAKLKEECIRFLMERVSPSSMWRIRVELKRLKKENNYFKFGKLTPLVAGLMHDIFCQSLK